MFSVHHINVDQQFRNILYKIFPGFGFVKDFIYCNAWSQSRVENGTQDEVNVFSEFSKLCFCHNKASNLHFASAQQTRLDPWDVQDIS